MALLTLSFSLTLEISLPRSMHFCNCQRVQKRHLITNLNLVGKVSQENKNGCFVDTWKSADMGGMPVTDCPMMVFWRHRSLSETTLGTTAITATSAGFRTSRNLLTPPNDVEFVNS